MGNGLILTCSKCGYHDDISLGVGFMFPTVYQETVTRIQAGEFGDHWKELFESIPGATVNAEDEFYACPSCGHYSVEPNLAIYAPKDPNESKVHPEGFSVCNPARDKEYVTPWEIGTKCRLVKTYVHRCPECGKRMHKTRTTDRLKCPKCKAGLMEETDAFNWD